ncbi:MAG TPA: hypothetical protein VFA38_11140 [Nitrospirales bacterium]|nr:hypothetical protein [Nitrospirales bacterium]
MAKIISAHHHETEQEKAREYVKTFILFPAGLLGLIFMVAGSAAMLYQFFTSSYTWQTFLESTGLLALGGVLGWGQTKYHRYLLAAHPDHFASRMRGHARPGQKKPRKEAPSSSVAHPGRRYVPLAYLGGALLLLGAATATSIAGHTYALAAFFLPWAGFFWAKMFFWRGVLPEMRR